MQILWINFAIDVLLAIGLGFDAAAPGLMRRAAARRGAPRSSTGRSRSASAPWRSSMAALALGIVAWGEDRYDLAVATTMGLTTLSLMHIVAALEVPRADRDDLQPLHDREPALRAADRRGARADLPRHRALPLQRIFDTVSLTSSQWGICLLGPIAYLAITELGKLYDRRSGHGQPALATGEVESPAPQAAQT